MTPRRIQMTRARPWRKDHPYAVIVARPSKWGNPFKIGAPGVPDAETAVRLFAESLSPYTHHGPAVHGSKIADLYVGIANMEDVEHDLRGKDLACWCCLCDAHRDGKPWDVDCPDCAPCHADVLLRMANE